MKILHVIPSVSERSGGPGQAIIPMCRALRDAGVEVQLATTDADLSGVDGKAEVGGQKSEVGATSYRGVPTVFFPKQLGESFKYSRPFAKWLDEHVAEFNVVHIHAVFNHACIAAARACRKRGVPYVVRPLGTLDPWSMRQKPLRKKVYWRAFGKTMLASAAAVHYTAEAEKKAAEQSLNLNHGVVVPLGVDLESLQSVDSGGGFLREFPMLAGRPYVLVLSRLHPKKGLEVLIDAFLSLVSQPQFANWRLVLAGEGSPAYLALLKRLINENCGADCFLFPGWLGGDLKVAALRGASLLALPSYHENFGLCVVEALACGVPVLISPHVNLATEVEAAGAGWVTPVEKAAIQIALVGALASDDERVRRGLAGKAFSFSFNWDIVATKLKRLYLSIVERRLRAVANMASYGSHQHE